MKHQPIVQRCVVFILFPVNYEKLAGPNVARLCVFLYLHQHVACNVLTGKNTHTFQTQAIRMRTASVNERLVLWQK